MVNHDSHNPEPMSRRAYIVTGAGSGIGAAVVDRIVAAGGSVLAADINIAGLAVLRERHGDAVRTMPVDVTLVEQTDAMVAEAVGQFGRLDGAVNSAGIGVSDPTPVDLMSDEQWRRVLSVNLDGMFHCLRAELRELRHRGPGSVVNIGSVMASVATKRSAAYVAAKHAVVGLTKAAALDAVEAGIRVNSVSPGFVDTPLLSPASRDAAPALIKRHPIGRLATPAEIAGAVWFLLSDEASFITGSDVGVDGGYTAV